MHSIRTFGVVLPGVKYVDRPGAYAFLYNANADIGVVRTTHGLFLPGGGVDADEDPLDGLARELFEEIGYELKSAKLVIQAAQYHWSEFYRTHFKKIGSFYQVEATPPPTEKFEKDHSLLWMPRTEAARVLSQEFQRWAVTQS